MGYSVQPLQPFFFLLSAIIAPLLSLPFIIWFSRWLKSQVGWISAFSFFLSIFSIICFFQWFGPKPYILFHMPWFSSLHISLSIMSDGLSLFFGIGVSLMAIIVSIYAKDHIDTRDSTRFFLFFSGLVFAFLAFIFSNDLMVMFIFFELIGIGVFLFIGFRHEDPQHYRYAFVSLLSQVGSAILLFIGGLLFYQQFGTFNLFSLLQMTPDPSSISGLTVCFFLLLFGVFISLAQFPFHTWISRSIQSPFPFSLFLNSIGFSAGLYVLIRLWPFFQTLPLFSPILIFFGLVGFVMSALYALFSHDTRLALLYTTLAHIGLCILVIGLSQMPVFSLSFTLFSHFLYKGLLFLILGIIFSFAHVTDLRQSYGLFKSHWFLGSAFLVGCLSLAGFPGTLGFIDHLSLLTLLMSIQSQFFPLSIFLMIIVSIGQLCLIAVSFRLFYCLFMGKEASPPRLTSRSTIRLEFFVALLAIPLVLLGIFPVYAYDMFTQFGLVSQHVVYSLPLWYTITTPFVIALIVLGFGCVLFGILHVKKWPISLPAALHWDHFYVGLTDQLILCSSKVDQFFKFDRPQQMILVSIGFFSFILAIASSIIEQTYSFSLPSLSAVNALYFSIAGVITLLCIGLIYNSQWLTKFIIFFVLMLALCVYYVLYRAPELAFFQLLFTLFLLIFVFILLKKIPTYRFFSHTPLTFSFNTLLKIIISGSFGITIVIVLSEVLIHQHPSPFGHFLLTKSTMFFPGITNFVSIFLSHIRVFDTVIVASIIGVCLFSCVFSHPSTIRGDHS